MAETSGIGIAGAHIEIPDALRNEEEGGGGGRGGMSVCICPSPNSLGQWTLLTPIVHPKGLGFDSRFSRHVGTLGKSFTRNCLWCFSVKLRHSIHAVSGAPLSISGLEEAL